MAAMPAVNYFLCVTFSAMMLASPGSGYETFLQEFPTNVFQRHIKVSRHQPFCVVFRNSSSGSQLEKVTYNLWQDWVTRGDFTNWMFGAFSPDKSRMPPNNKIPDKTPAMRCYLGESSAYQYAGQVKKSQLKNWLTKLRELYEEQSTEVTPELLDQVQRQNEILLVAFPDGPRHHEVEDIIYGLADELDSCKAMAVHLNSPHVGPLKKKYGVTKYPAVVVIHNKVVNDTVQEQFEVFAGHNVKSHVMKVYITAKSVVAPILSMQAFEALLDGPADDPVWEFRPVLICFYAHWAGDVPGYLHAYNMTVQQYRESRVNLRFGMIDLVKDSSKKFLSRYLRSGAMKEVPFLALYYKDSSGTIKSSYLHIGSPYPWVMYKPIENLGQGLLELTGIQPYQDPWGTLSYDQYSSVNEGPNGTICTAWAHNMTDNTPFARKPVIKKKRVIKKPVVVKSEEPVKKSVHDLFDTDTLESKLDVYENIPLLTGETWTDIVEKSHAPRHIFYKSGKWAGEVTKVSMVVFIMADCGNCRRNNQTFRDIQKAVHHIDGGSVYYVNCTAEPILCRTHNIRGFPTITAFRGLGWMDTSTCLTGDSQKKFKKHVRLDYHGVIRGQPVLEWFSRIADNSIININKDHLPKSFQDKDVWLIASVAEVPRESEDMTPVPYWSYKCLRLLCERLYSILDCFSIHTGVLSEDADVMVTKLTLRRRDGVKAIVMKTGVPLLETVEDQQNEQLHKFHQPHTYKLNASQTCEENPSACTDVITEFILDHSRLPVTSLTSDMFHTSTSLLKEEELPILMALAHPENLTQTSQFLKDLTLVANDLYNDLVVMTLDVRKYSVWATQFVPALYGHARAFESDDPDPLSMFTYPRLVIVKKTDHKHAALYPPTTRKRRADEEFSREIIYNFAKSYIQEPEKWIIETEHF